MFVGMISHNRINRGFCTSAYHFSCECMCAHSLHFRSRFGVYTTHWMSHVVKKSRDRTHCQSRCFCECLARKRTSGRPNEYYSKCKMSRMGDRGRSYGCDAHCALQRSACNSTSIHALLCDYAMLY